MAVACEGRQLERLEYQAGGVYLTGLVFIAELHVLIVELP